MGLGYAAGLGLLPQKIFLPRVFCILGDGECDEGSIWESAAFIGHKSALQCDGLHSTRNRMQLDGPCASIWTPDQLQESLMRFWF